MLGQVVSSQMRTRLLAGSVEDAEVDDDRRRHDPATAASRRASRVLSLGDSALWLGRTRQLCAVRRRLSMQARSSRHCSIACSVRVSIATFMLGQNSGVAFTDFCPIGLGP